MDRGVCSESCRGGCFNEKAWEGEIVVVVVVVSVFVNVLITVVVVVVVTGILYCSLMFFLSYFLSYFHSYVFLFFQTVEATLNFFLFTFSLSLKSGAQMDASPDKNEKQYPHTCIVFYYDNPVS